MFISKDQLDQIERGIADLIGRVQKLEQQPTTASTVANPTSDAYTPGVYSELATIQQSLEALRKYVYSSEDEASTILRQLSVDLDQLTKATNCRKRSIAEVPAKHYSAVPTHTIIEKIPKASKGD